MIIEAAIGDAFGAGYEYAAFERIGRENTRYIQHQKHTGIRPGMYTDDTQMSLAIAELLISGDDWTPHNIAKAFLEVFHRDQREGYAGGFYKFLMATTTAEEFIKNIKPFSDKSGAAMRAWPLGVLRDIDQVVSYCKTQAAVTHNTESGIESATASALMTHYFIRAIGSKSDLPQWLVEQLGGIWATPHEGKVGSKGWMSTLAAVTAVARNDNLHDLLVDCINFTGDVDTVATIAMAAASCSSEYESNIPTNLVLTLENGEFGREYIGKLDEKIQSLSTAKA